MLAGPDHTVRTILAAAARLLAETTADSNTLWGRLLKGQSAEEIAEQKAAFRGNPPIVKLGYALTDSRWPVWAVVLESDSPAHDFVGRTAEFDDEGRETNVMVCEPVVGIHTLTTNEDTTRQQYTLIKALLLTLRKTMAEAGFHPGTFRGGRDLNPQELMLPQNVWPRVQSWAFFEECEAETSEDDEGIFGPLVYAARNDVDRGDGDLGDVDTYSAYAGEE
jgi:hypothetical protein